MKCEFYSWINSLITDILVLFLWNSFSLSSVPTHVSLRLMSAICSGLGWETRTLLQCTFPSQALALCLVPACALCRGSFRAVPRPRCGLLPLCAPRPGLGARGTARPAAPPWGSSPGGWRTALDTQRFLRRGDPAHPHPAQFTLQANSADVFSRIMCRVQSLAAVP